MRSARSLRVPFLLYANGAAARSHIPLLNHDGGTSTLKSGFTVTEGRDLNILLVEDSPADARFTREALDASGLASHLALLRDGGEAMRYLRRQGEYIDARRPDVVLLDLNLPVRDGREVLREMKSDPELRIIPVVMFTRSTRDEDVAELYLLHANCYISKPVDFDRFVEVVQGIERFWGGIATVPSA